MFIISFFLRHIFKNFYTKLIKLWRIYVLEKYWTCIYYAVAGSTASFTNLSGGKQVDGLPPAFNYCPRRDFSFLCLIPCGGKFILAINNFGSLFMYIKGSVEYDFLGKSYYRKQAGDSFEMMKEISPASHKIIEKNIFHLITIK